MAEWMAFNVADYVSNTLHLTTRQHGAYILAICAAWEGKGLLPGSDAGLRAITKLSAKEWAVDGPVLKGFLTWRDGAWVHERVEHEYMDSQAMIDGKRKAGAEGARKRWEGRTNSRPMATPSQTHRHNDAPLPLPKKESLTAAASSPSSAREAAKSGSAIEAPAASPNAAAPNVSQQTVGGSNAEAQVQPVPEPDQPSGAAVLQNLPRGVSTAMAQGSPSQRDEEAVDPKGDFSLAGDVFRLYQQVAKFNNWPDPGFLNSHTRWLIEERAKELEKAGPDLVRPGFVQCFSKAAGAAFLREADGRTPKPFVRLTWLVEQENFAKILEGKYDRVHKPAAVDVPRLKTARDALGQEIELARETTAADAQDATVDRG